MLRVGLTGGIGSGKTTVAGIFARHGVPVIDADEIARALVTPGTPGHRAVVDAFGKEILDANNEIDRGRLREQVFQDRAARKRLEAILHPRVHEEIQKQAAGLDAPYCLIVIPLLIEAGQQDLVDRILVIDADDEVRIRRVARRDGLPPDEIERIMKAQLSRQERLRHADDIIRNNRDLDDLERQVERLHARYLELGGTVSSNRLLKK